MTKPGEILKRGEKGGGRARPAEIEALRRRRDDLERVNAELIRRDRLKDEFISNVSHELRTSLASVKNVISNALAGVSGELPDKLRRSLLTADENIKRFGGIINDLLDVARLESGRMVLYRSLVDPVRTVEGAISAFEEEAAKRGIILRSSWDVPPMLVFADSDRIAQVMGNLIGNALKFTPWGGVIAVRGIVLDADLEEISGERLKVLPEGSNMAVEVSDTGPGIDPKRIEMIFDRFEQAEAKEHTIEEGLGLGLAICKQLVTLHGGRLWARNSKEGGAAFTFTIPLLGHEEMFREALSDRLRTATIYHYPVALVLFGFAGVGAESAEITEGLAWQVEMAIRNVLRRKSDTAMWRGGGRFGVILPQTTAEQAHAVAKRIGDATCQPRRQFGGETTEMSSIHALAAYPDDADSAESLIATAEERFRECSERS